jgi:hypothetical protein
MRGMVMDVLDRSVLSNALYSYYLSIVGDPYNEYIDSWQYDNIDSCIKFIARDIIGVYHLVAEFIPEDLPLYFDAGLIEDLCYALYTSTSYKDASLNPAYAEVVLQAGVRIKVLDALGMEGGYYQSPSSSPLSTHTVDSIKRSIEKSYQKYEEV